MAEFETMRSTAAGRVGEIDEGLRTHMNKVYGTMSVGMLITALAAWAIAGLATTSDPALAAGQMANGTLLTSFGVAIYTSALRWIVMLAPLGMIFGFGAIMQRASASGAQLFFFLFATLIGVSLSSIFVFYTTFLNRADLFSHRDRFCRLVALGLHHEERHFGLGLFSDHGRNRHFCSDDRQYVPRLSRDNVCDFGSGRFDLCRPNRL